MAVSVVQAIASVELGNSTSGSQGFSGATTAGNTIVVGVNMFSAVSGATIPNVLTLGDGHNTYTKAATSEATKASGTYGMKTVFYYATGIVGGSETISITIDTSTYFYLTLWELSPAQFDQACANSGTNASNGNLNAGSLTPNASGSVEMFLGDQDGGSTASWAPVGWTDMVNAVAGGGGTYVGYQTQSTPASIAFSVAYNNSPINWAASGIVFIPPPSGPAALSISSVN